MSKLSVICTAFHPLRRNTLCGFATIRIRELHLEISGVAIHEKNGKRWCQLPARPQLNKDGTVIRGDDGKITYAPVMAFTSRAIADAFSTRVIAAVLDAFPHAFSPPEQEAAQ